MELVASGTGYELSLRCTQPGIDLRVGGRDVDLLDEAFLERNHSEKSIRSNERVLVVDAVEREVVEGASGSIDGCRASSARAGHPGLRESQLGHASSVQGKLLDLLPVEVGVDFRVDSVHRRLRRGHHDRLVHHAHLEDDVDRGGRVHFDLDAFEHGRFETRQLRGNRVGPRGRLRKHVEADFIRLGLQRYVRIDVRQRHRSPWYDGAALILHRPIHSGRENLPGRGNGQGNQNSPLR